MWAIIKRTSVFIFMTFVITVFSLRSVDAAPITHTFTNAGAAGISGPTQVQIDSAYNGTNLQGKVTSSNGIQTWTVPGTGTYTIEVQGAQGGTQPDYNNGGGLGARLKGDFQLNQGDVLKILVGQQGTNASGDMDAGGGGGTFVVKVNPSSSYTMADSTKVTPLIIAGGGAGDSADYNGADASTSTSSTGASVNTSSGNGATFGAGSGGGGFITNGISQNSGVGGKSFLNGGAGGNATSKGGFGGGAGGYDEYGAGGGGYSGGPGYDGPSGGGGSYNAGTNASSSVVGTGNGYVKITYESVTVNLTLPTSGQAISKGSSINFQWSGASPFGSILSYTLQIGTIDGGSDKLNKAEGTKTSDTIDISNLTLWPSGTYYWQVIATDSTGKNGFSKGTFIISNTKPTVAIGGITPNKYSAVSGYDKLRVSGTVQDLNKDTAVKIYYRIDGTQWTGTQIGSNIATTGGNDAFTTVDIPVGSYSEGSHTLYVWANDGVENSTEATFSFTVDKSAPNGLNIKINNDAAYANTVPMSLTLSAVDAVKMFISKLSTTPTLSSVNAAGTSTGWTTYTTSYSWSTAPQDGTFTIYAWFMDDVGNISSSASDSVVYKATAPNVPTINPNTRALTNGDITFTIDYPSDAAVKQFKVGTTGVYQDYSTARNVTLNFTNAGASGQSGPSQAQVNTAYAGTPLSGNVTVDSNGIQTWTVPYTGIYHIEAYGAQGGNAYLYGTSTNNSGGKGAKISGDFQLNANDTLRLLVGQQGGSVANSYRGGGGGGGTFVVSGTNTLLLTAGGGGGAGQYALTSSSDGQNAANGGTGSNGGAGGQNGNGGSVGSYGGAGAGWISNGSSNVNGYGYGGSTFSNGGRGGTGYSDGTYGGFGGGGGSYAGAGGGGGYSGGGSGGWSYSGAGGGGGSFIASSASNTSLTAGNNTGYGKVVITYTIDIKVTANNTVVYAKGQDAAGNWSQEASYTVTNIDRQAPTGSFVINKKTDGLSSTYANVSPLVLTITAQDDRSQTSNIKFYVSNTNTAPAVSASGWMNFPSTSAYNYPYTGADGPVNLYIWFKDEAGNVSSAAGGSIVFDKTPISGTVAINAGAARSNKRDVTLTLTKIYNAATDYASASKVIISNKQDMTESQTFDYQDSINWILDGDGNKNVYVKYIDWAGNTTAAAFADSILCDTTGPTVQITINGGASTTNQGSVMLTIIAKDELSPLSGKMMLSNRQDFRGAVWETLVNTRNSWPIDSATAGVKTVYIKVSDDLSNETIANTTINYATVVTGASTGTSGTGTSSGTGGTSGTGASGGTSGTAINTGTFLSTVQHYQRVILSDGTIVFVTGPNSPITLLSDSQASSLRSKSVLFNNDTAYFSLAFEVTPQNASKIHDMAVDLDFNNLNQEGITFIIERADLNQYRDGSYKTIKPLTSSIKYNGRNRYLISLGNDNGGTPMLAANSNVGNKYSIDYTVKVVAKKTIEEISDSAVEVQNNAQVKIYTGEGLYTEYIEPIRPSRQFDIITKVSRAVR